MASKPRKNLSPDDQAKYDQLPPQLKQIVDQNTNMASKSAQIQQLFALVSQGAGTNTQIGGGSAAPTFNPSATQTYTDRFESAIGLEGGRRVDIASGATIPGTTTRVGTVVTPYGASPGFAPRYFERDADLIARFSRDQIADIQAKLNKSGLLGSKYRIGVIDDATRKAWVELLGEANRSNVDWNTALSTATASPIGGGTGALPPRVSNPEDIKKIVQQVSSKILGRSADQNVVDQIVRQFQASQVQSQTGLPMSGGRRVEPMDLQNLAEQKIRRAAGPEANAFRFAQFAERVFGAAGSGTGVPETSMP
jgi:hypothetical protein